MLLEELLDLSAFLTRAECADRTRIFRDSGFVGAARLRVRVLVVSFRDDRDLVVHTDRRTVAAAGHCDCTAAGERRSRSAASPARTHRLLGDVCP